MTNPVCASHLALIATGMASQPGAFSGSFQCNFCGGEFEGEGHKYKPSPKFNNHADTKSTGVVCKYCKVVLSGSTYMLQLKNAVYANDGAYTINKDIELAYFMHYPPSPPFIVTFGTTKQQHLVWRTPISYCKELFQFRFGDELFVIDRKKVLKIAALYRQTIDDLNDLLKSESAKNKTIASMFARPTSGIRNKSDCQAAMISHRILDFIDSTFNDPDAGNSRLELAHRLSSLISKLESLNFGELFLLLPVTKFKKAQLKALQLSYY